MESITLTNREEWDKEDNEHHYRPDIVRGELLAISRIIENMNQYQSQTDKTKAFDKVVRELKTFLDMYREGIEKDEYLKDLIKFEDKQDED